MKNKTKNILILSLISLILIVGIFLLIKFGVFNSIFMGNINDMNCAYDGNSGMDCSLPSGVIVGNPTTSDGKVLFKIHNYKTFWYSDFGSVYGDFLSNENEFFRVNNPCFNKGVNQNVCGMGMIFERAVVYKSNDGGSSVILKDTPLFSGSCLWYVTPTSQSSVTDSCGFNYYEFNVERIMEDNFNNQLITVVGNGKKTFGFCDMYNGECWIDNVWASPEEVTLSSIRIDFKVGGGELPKATFYRFQNNECSQISILPSEKTSNDYSSLDDCENNIIQTENQITIYRLENNLCNEYVIDENNKLNTDYTSLNKCEKDIVTEEPKDEVNTKLITWIAISIIIIFIIIILYFILRKSKRRK